VTTHKVAKIDIKKSTTRAGCVDLGKIRELRANRKKKRSDGIKKINEQKNLIVSLFQKAYEEIVGGTFQLRNRTSFSSWKDKNGTVYKKKHATDKQRLWDAYRYATDHNGAELENMGAYFHHAVEEAQRRYKVKSPRQIFGYVVNQGVIESWFMDKSRKRVLAKENEQIEARAEEHAKLFDR